MQCRAFARRDTTTQSTTETISPAESFPHGDALALASAVLARWHASCGTLVRIRNDRTPPCMNPHPHPGLVTPGLNDIRIVFTCDAAQSACERIRHCARDWTRAPNGRCGKSTSTGG